MKGQGAGKVAEIQGLYGPFTFPEKLLQRIWLGGEFDRAAAVTTAGRHVQVLHPGRWNLLGGPDFKGARLRLDGGPVVTGDVELHLDAGDWAAHGHAHDAAYDAVVLHVVLFPPDPARRTLGAGGREIPVLVLLPLLLHDLEEYAADAAVEALANRPLWRVPEELGQLSGDALQALLRRTAQARWQQKVHFARLRIQRLGWDAACHHAALEILGYRFNRAPMLRLASALPLASWPGLAGRGDAPFATEAGAWSLQGVRPANHPHLRLRQYAHWVGERPDWPARLKALAQDWPTVAVARPSTAARRELAFARRRGQVATEVCAAAVGGTRLDNLLCDGFFPLLTAGTRRDLAGWWFHWFPGDMPPQWARALRDLGAIGSRGRPACHGLGQGLLGWLLERERADGADRGRGA